MTFHPPNFHQDNTAMSCGDTEGGPRAPFSLQPGRASWLSWSSRAQCCLEGDSIRIPLLPTCLWSPPSMERCVNLKKLSLMDLVVGQGANPGLRTLYGSARLQGVVSPTIMACGTRRSRGVRMEVATRMHWELQRSIPPPRTYTTKQPPPKTPTPKGHHQKATTKY